MIWTAVLLIAFLVVGLSQGALSRRRHLMVFTFVVLALAGMYLTFGAP